jgi:DNA-binding MarR family transcriptional regulator
MLEQELSRKFIDVIPRTMRSIRNELRNDVRNELTVAQFRVLGYIGRHEQSSNRELAEHIGVKPPVMSRLVETLVKKGFISRASASEDRRQVILKLSPRGKKRYEASRQAAREKFAVRFATLGRQQRDSLAKGLAVLEEIFR